MATNGNDLIDELLLRHRAAGVDRIARADAATVLSQCQRVVNLHKTDNTATVSFTPTAGQTLYTVAGVASDVARIDTVRHDDRDLHRVDFRSLAHCDTRWLHRTSNRYDLFSRIGGSLWVLYPAMESPVAVDVVYTIVPAAVADAATAIDISDEYVPLLLDLAEAVLTARVRVWSALPDLTERIRKAVGAPAPLEEGNF
jgi:hypothetical protein